MTKMKVLYQLASHLKMLKMFNQIMICLRFLKILILIRNQNLIVVKIFLYVLQELMTSFL